MLNVDNTALVIIDVQGKLATLMHEKDRLFANLVRITKGAQALNLPILWNEQLPDKLGPTIPELKELLKGQEPIVKNTFSCWGNATFKKALGPLSVKNTLLVGIETHVCVYQSAVDLIEEGFDVHLVVDAVSSRFDYNYDLGIERIKELGARLTSVEMSLFEMLKVAEGDAFKQVIQIVK
jgi:nicotinamidase-related amidase